MYWFSIVGTVHSSPVTINQTLRAQKPSSNIINFASQTLPSVPYYGSHVDPILLGIPQNVNVGSINSPVQVAMPSPPMPVCVERAVTELSYRHNAPVFDNSQALSQLELIYFNTCKRLSEVERDNMVLRAEIDELKIKEVALTADNNNLKELFTNSSSKLYTSEINYALSLSNIDELNSINSALADSNALLKSKLLMQSNLLSPINKTVKVTTPADNSLASHYSVPVTK